MAINTKRIIGNIAKGAMRAGLNGGVTAGVGKAMAGAMKAKYGSAMTKDELKGAMRGKKLMDGMKAGAMAGVKKIK
jgi:hypothetical protein